MSLFDMVFGCWHKRCSFPINIRGKLRRSTTAVVRHRDLRCLPRLRSRVPVRLVADEDARVQAPYWVGGKARHCRSRSQGRLRPVLDHSQRPSPCVGSGKSLLFPRREAEVPLLNYTILNDKEKTDEYKHEG
jgi:hypothetical protein